MGSAKQPVSLMPGFNVPLNKLPKKNVFDSYAEGFPLALLPEEMEAGMYATTQREIVMMRFMNTIMEKPEWDRKIFDTEITAKWRNEIAQSGQDVSPKMIDWIVKEVEWKAKILKETGIVSAFDPGVFRSDAAVPEEVRQALKDAVKPLEDVPEDQKDYHPGSDNQVINLVHPSLFPIVYGRTRVLADNIIDLDDCLHHVGEGELIPIPPKKDLSHANYGSLDPHSYSDWPELYSGKFQWLPCEVKLLDGGDCQIVSYINNAHPVQHKALYEVVEKVISWALPLWENSLSELPNPRIAYREVEYAEHPEPEPEGLSDDEDFDQNEFDDAYTKWLETQPIILPEPGEFVPPTEAGNLNIQRHFPETNLQVIVKLANIELTPEKPNYNGGSWHIEGQLNERICATALYYYDNENINENTLDFRKRATIDEELSYEQGRHEFLQAVFGFGDDVGSYGGDNTTQHIGGVLCKEGRLLTFPNTIQHRVSSFSLTDPSKPGHRKILALFLVDPHHRVISSANEWAQEKQGLVDQVLSRLPAELQSMVEKGLDPLMTMEEAKKLRLELMEERGRDSAAANIEFERGDFSLCEH
ncbi:Protein of unknown function DUF4246 [Penicillium cosmopolitanum]|uniref:Uncharacterized protein n=1 Tax=Penicillium cosmopolitanum TaxID=1131564 RepID=A0A9W9SCH7_9EURO|nr:Protein of unknown function DUF4246 [Penicillium cosmopolitanum]KAJ5376113.1 Protein of unknown function DUF4246 [Penicillium cosmopolitanum]